MVDQRSLNRKADGYNVEFIDEDAGWSQTVHRVLRPNLPEKEPGTYNHSSIKLDFTTSYLQAMWHARRMMAKEIHRHGELKVQVGKEGRYYKPGSLIKVQHERFKIGLGSGEITELIRNGNHIVGLKLMERFDISKDRDYWIEYYVVDAGRNHVVTKQIQSVGEYTDKLTFTVPLKIDSPDVPAIGNILSAMHGEKTETPRVWEAKRYLVSDLSENPNGYDLTLVPYSEIVYQTTTIDEIPDYQSLIINSPPRVFSDVNDRQMMLENRIPNAQGLATVIDNISTANIANISPRYRGATNTPDLENTGIINGNGMNAGDYIIYKGVTNGFWQSARMYQWNGREWEFLIIKENRGKYLDGINDLTDVVLDGVFGNAFIQTLVAEIFSKNLIIKSGGSIRSENYIEGASGFIIKGDGYAEFNN